jgi:DNA replication protein DnaC
MEKQNEAKLKQLRGAGMDQGWQTLIQNRQHVALSLNEGLELLIQREEEERQYNRFHRMIRGARFRYQASLEELIYDPKRGINKAQITSLVTCHFIKKGEAILISGSTGCGKSYLASAFGHQACLNGYSVIYSNTQKFMQKNKMARTEGSIMKYFDKIAKVSLLILDDFGLTMMDQQQQFNILEVIEDRHGKTSTIIASQLPPAS